jgi:hypothetical protein
MTATTRTAGLREVNPGDRGHQLVPVQDRTGASDQASARR